MSEISKPPTPGMARDCTVLPIDPSLEENCQEPYHVDDGVPYCDTCGYYRRTIHRQWKARLQAMNDATPVVFLDGSSKP